MAAAADPAIACAEYVHANAAMITVVLAVGIVIGFLVAYNWLFPAGRR